ncbi:S-layer homology domain-containing protein [Chamaesiphon sp. VAR_48_metabat_135_sub]|uniref:S-layer homology domain-containing protein n=1 Tax=Chamaesiphon sp. VAR_48_metabat_135_sub TaxID=2964699 RepID=UPI00286A7E89|nr:S-layer homology domain-containing protein [Chamaesiphon sp. VAR_48_metabat_135_sub]
MNQNKQQSNFKRAQIGRLASLLLGSVFTGVLITTGSAFAVPNAPENNNSSNKVTVSAPLAAAVKENKNTAPVTPATDKVAQASDVAGNWAEPFIKALVEKEIIKGYPDGTFKPDQPVTRAEFAALLNKAFDLKQVRAGRKFKDVPKKFWASAVIQKAYQSGFLTGYPNGTFAPKQNIIRIQSLVSLVNGSKLEPSGSLDINGVFGDAAQVPSYGQNALVAATQRCIAVSVEYDSSKLPGGNFGPNTVATRADVAAYIHQVLVGSGRLTALDKASPANKYIASCPQGVYVTSITGTPVEVPKPMTADEAIAKLSIPSQVPEVSGSTSVATFPVGGLGTPTAFGANWGDLFFGAGFQGETRPNIYSNTNLPNNPAATAAEKAKGPETYAYSVGLGLGDARNFLGLETVATTYNRTGSGSFENGGISFKLHKLLGDNFAIAGGYENAVTFGNNPATADGGVNGGRTGYGVASLILNPDPNMGFFSNTTLSVGAGAGRFRSVGDIRANNDTINVFGSIGTRLFSNVSLVADWNGQDASVGLPISIPFGGGSSFQVTPAIVDLGNSETGGSRFVVSGGLGFHF